MPIQKSKAQEIEKMIEDKAISRSNSYKLWTESERIEVKDTTQYILYQEIKDLISGGRFAFNKTDSFLSRVKAAWLILRGKKKIFYH